MRRLPGDGIAFHELDDARIPNVPHDSLAQAIVAADILVPAGKETGLHRPTRIEESERLLCPLLDRSLVEEYRIYCIPPRILSQVCKSLRKKQEIVRETVFGDWYLVAALR